jgi:hypothetical protein
MAKQSTRAAIRSAGVMGAARWKGEAGNRGKPVMVGGRGFDIAEMAMDRAGVGQGRITVESG